MHILIYLCSVVIHTLRNITLPSANLWGNAKWISEGSEKEGAKAWMERGEMMDAQMDTEDGNVF